MDNRVVIGVGNIYANEALFRAGIRPSTPANALSRPRLARLVDAVRAVLEAAIAKGGSTLRDYVGSDGAAGLLPARLFRLWSRGRRCRVCGRRSGNRGSASARRSIARSASR